MRENTASYLTADADLAARLRRISRFSRTVRSSEYQITNACNIRCKGCWFFSHGVDRATSDARDVARWRDFARQQRVDRGITHALLIGGEPTLFPERISSFVEHMPYVTISSNGLKKLEREGFEKVQIVVSLFGGGLLDDQLRAIRPGGGRFTGLFDSALRSYHNDDRVCFNLALAHDGIQFIEETVERVRDNGNILTFNYYVDYSATDPHERGKQVTRLLEEALRVRERYPETVRSAPYFIRSMLTGKADWGVFGYQTCPSISRDHEAHRERIASGAPALPGFNTYAADTETLQFCCTSGNCQDCRDSQAVLSWLLVSFPQFLELENGLRTWVEVAESYWAAHVWSPFHKLSHTDMSASDPSVLRPPETGLA